MSLKYVKQKFIEHRFYIEHIFSLWFEVSKLFCQLFIGLTCKNLIKIWKIQQNY